MAGPYSGVDGIALFDAVDVDCTGFTFDWDDSGFDSTTTAGQGWSDEDDAVRGVSGSVDLFFTTKSAAILAAQMFTRPRVHPVLKLSMGGGAFATGTARRGKASIKSTVKEGVTVTFSFKSEGAWTFTGITP